ncbi:MAG: hypothetical protein R3320_13605 [Nitriliruptorales bacterium]|nr:hypothetical protein [Nitriliruptorales bacterium]
MLAGFDWRTAVLTVVGLMVLTVAADASPSSASDGQQRYEALDPLSTEAGSVEEIEATAIELVDELGSLPASAGSSDPCPTERLAVSWDEPRGFTQGAYVGEVGPAPTPETSFVVGIVYCEGSTFAFVGFEAVKQDDGTWLLSTIPTFPDESDLDHDHEPEVPDLHDPRVVPSDLLELSDLELGPIDPYAPYEPQRICDADPKPGTVALAQLLLEIYPETRNFGIARACDAGPRSEHKEGRAFDWGARVVDAEERAAVEDFIGRLMATDAEGNQHALARRMGVMYLIWNRQIWSSHRADEGWRPYNGPSAHVDHVHASLSWDGAMGETSLWQAALPTGWWAAYPPLADAIAIGLGPLAPGRAVDSGFWWSRDGGSLLPDRSAPDSEGSDSQQGSDSTATQDGADGDGSSGSDSSDTGLVDDTTGTVEDTVNDTTDTVEDTTDTVEDTVNDTTDTVDDTTDTVEDTASELVSPSESETIDTSLP